MAVYTELEQGDIERFLEVFDVGHLLSYEAISEGIENTNYFVNTEKDGEPYAWVLTLFENLDEEELPYFSDLTTFLAEKGFKVPAPKVGIKGLSVFDLKGRKAILVPKLKGRSTSTPGIENCAAIGSWLAKMHIALEGFEQHRPLVRDEAWMLKQMNLLDGNLPTYEYALLRRYVERYQNYRVHLERCSQGTVHGDLFRDNVLFQGNDITGVIDFYHACDATLLFDLAVVANDWATENGSYHQKRLAALVDAYRSARDWTVEDIENWPYCLELAALRFWISRLVSKYVPGYQQGSVQGETIKDPDEMKCLLPEI